MQLLSSQHSRPAPACLGRQPGTAASRPSCLLARHGQRAARRVQARAVPPRASPGASPVASVDQGSPLGSMDEEARARKSMLASQAAELQASAQELAQQMQASTAKSSTDYSETERVLAAPSMPYVPSGAPETTWYCWPDGYIGQSFGLAGKLEPRASPLQQEVDVLSEFVVRRRESCRYSEHTIDSARAASQMLQATVGGAVDLGLFNASGSASLELSRSFSSKSISHSLVASFQENELLEMLSPSLSLAAKDVLLRKGPHAFAARYGTHFVSGVGYRGAFIGSITVKLSDVKMAAGASLQFKASYDGATGMVDLKSKMEQSLNTSDITFTWHKYGVTDDSSLDQLENYCASDDANFASMRALAMHTADQARGYPKLIKLRPYSSLPEYVDACSRHCADNKMQPVELQDLEQALSFLTKQYRKASYIMQVIENDKRLNVLNAPTEVRQQRGSLAYRVKSLLQLMEAIFKTKDAQVEDSVPGTYFNHQPSLYLLRVYFKYDARPSTVDAIHAGAFGNATKLKQQLDEVDRLDYELFKAVQRPFMMAEQNVNQYTPKLEVGNTTRTVTIGVASNASPNRPFGSWWLDYAEQETFTKPGMYVVRLVNYKDDTGAPPRLEQVGRTQFFAKADDAAGSAAVIKAIREYLEECMERDPGTIGGDPKLNLFVMFAVGWDLPVAEAGSPDDRKKIFELTNINLGQKGAPPVNMAQEAVNFASKQGKVFTPYMMADPEFFKYLAAVQGPTSLGSFAAVSLTDMIYNEADFDDQWKRRRVASFLNSPPASSVPLSLIMVEQALPL